MDFQALQTPRMVDFGREICGEVDAADRREWLVTNGLGSYGAGTVSGAPSRSYHGLLVGALQPPVERTLLVAQLLEEVDHDGVAVPLVTLHAPGGSSDPGGHRHLESFRLEGTIPCWTYALGEARLEKRIVMPVGVQATYVHYRLRDGHDPLPLRLRVLVNHRSHHGGAPTALHPETDAAGVRVRPQGADPFHLRADRGRWSIPDPPTWCGPLLLAREAERGLPCCDAHLHAATVHVELTPGRPGFSFVASTDPSVPLDGEAVLAARSAHERALLRRWRQAWPHAAAAPAWIAQLVLAADQFLVDRHHEAGKQASGGRSVIAGYPWFDDWGRDTMISLPGLALATGRAEEAAGILRTYAATVDRGMLPNRFPERARPLDPLHDYNTVDAALWFFQALDALLRFEERSGVPSSRGISLLRDLFPTLAAIVDHHRRGSRYGIREDPVDGLLRAGEADSQLTWMDARFDDTTVTPRVGKPVEVNALWHGALVAMAGFARRLGEDPAPWRRLEARTRRGFARFWCPERGHCFDVLDTPAGGPDPSLRPNQLLALSLPAPLLPPAQERSILRVCGRRLLTSHGLRSLDPHDPRYRGRYGGDRAERDRAYHQGTVWSWWLGPFVLAHARVFGDPRRALSFLEPMAHHLGAAGLGSISEIFDGDPPHAPRGCFAQAWSVAEVLRSWTELSSRA